MIKPIISLVLLLTCFNVTASNFPRPAALEPAIQFWVKVYTNVSTQQGYIHDDENLAIIYQTLDVPPRGTAREHQITVARQQVIGALKTLGKGKRDGLSNTEERVLAAWPADTSSATYTRAAGRVRFQLGQSDRFKEGLVRSGQWKPHIRSVLAQYGLPGELEVLPHVESSFNPSAYSKVAAAGMWQFMPATARQYMRVDHILDERMDPFIATDGAARLLKTNYRITGTWPLALTSYNHGAGGMMRASKSVGTTDIDVIVKQYKGRAFGFASRNFYASFLAALQIDSNPGRYFGDFNVFSPGAKEVHF
jgi:membrane-bound lytic murein transglycosylase D